MYPQPCSADTPHRGGVTATDPQQISSTGNLGAA